MFVVSVEIDGVSREDPHRERRKKENARLLHCVVKETRMIHSRGGSCTPVNDVTWDANAVQEMHALMRSTECVHFSEAKFGKHIDRTPPILA